MNRMNKTNSVYEIQQYEIEILECIKLFKHVKDQTTLSKLQGLLADYELELYDLARDIRPTYQHKLDQFKAEYELLKLQVKSVNTCDSTNFIEIESMPPSEVLNFGAKIQKTDLQLLHHDLELLENASSVGIQTLTNLDTQREYLEMTTINLDGLDSNITRAKKSLVKFIKQTGRDKCIWIIILLIIGAIIFIVTWTTTHHSPVFNTTMSGI